MLLLGMPSGCIRVSSRLQLEEFVDFRENVVVASGPRSHFTAALLAGSCVSVFFAP